MVLFPCGCVIADAKALIVPKAAIDLSQIPRQWLKDLESRPAILPGQACRSIGVRTGLFTILAAAGSNNLGADNYWSGVPPGRQSGC